MSAPQTSVSFHRVREPVVMFTSAFFTLVPVGLAWLTYRDLVGNFFYADDFEALYDIGNTGAWPFVGELHLGHAVAVRNLVLLATRATFGLEARWWFLTVLLTHMLNAALLFGVIRNITGSRVAASATASWWAVARSHERSLGWYASFGHVLATTLILLVLLDATQLVTHHTRPRRRRLFVWVVLLLASSQCFGTALTVGPVLALALPSMFPEHGGGWRWSFALSLLAAIATLYWVERTYSPPTAGALIDAARPPGASDFRVLASMWLGLVRAGIGTFALGPAARLEPGRLPSPATALAYASLVMAAVSLRYRQASRSYWPILGPAMLAGAAYIAVAAGRSTLGGNVAYLATTARYQYLPQAFLAISVAAAVRGLTGGARLPPYAGTLLWGITVCGIVAVVVARPIVIAHHDDDRKWTTRTLSEIEAAAAAYPGTGPAVLPNRTFPPMAIPEFFEPPGRFPGTAGLFVAFSATDTVRGRPIRFVARTSDEYEFAQRRGGRIARLLMPPTAPRAAP